MDATQNRACFECWSANKPETACAVDRIIRRALCILLHIWRCLMNFREEAPELDGS